METSGLTGRVGVTITHGHHLLNNGQSIIGKMLIDTNRRVFVSGPQVRSLNTCPTTWVATKDGLMPSEGIENPSEQMVELAHEVLRHAPVIQNRLLQDPHAQFSTCSVAIDPRLLFETPHLKFVETNDDEQSILQPSDSVDGAQEEEAILTFVSMDPPNADPTEVKCVSKCNAWCVQGKNGKPHYDRHYKTHSEVS